MRGPGRGDSGPSVAVRCRRLDRGPEAARPSIQFRGTAASRLGDGVWRKCICSKQTMVSFDCASYVDVGQLTRV